MSEEPIVEPIASPKGDFKKLGRNSQAVVGELREFLATLKGKSPKEMMGAVAESGLFQSLLVSTVVIWCLVFALSIIPYYLNQGDGEAEAPGIAGSVGRFDRGRTGFTFRGNRRPNQPPFPIRSRPSAKNG